MWTNDFMHGDSHIPRPTNQWFFFSHTLCLSINIAAFSLPLLLIIAFSFLRLLFFHFIALLIFYNHCYLGGRGRTRTFLLFTFRFPTCLKRALPSLHILLWRRCFILFPHQSAGILSPFLFVSLLRVISLGKWMFCDVVYSSPNRFLWHSFTFCAPILQSIVRCAHQTRERFIFFQYCYFQVRQLIVCLCLTLKLWGGTLCSTFVTKYLSVAFCIV